MSRLFSAITLLLLAISQISSAHEETKTSTINGSSTVAPLPHSKAQIKSSTLKGISTASDELPKTTQEFVHSSTVTSKGQDNKATESTEKKGSLSKGESGDSASAKHSEPTAVSASSTSSSKPDEKVQMKSSSSIGTTAGGIKKDGETTSHPASISKSPEDKITSAADDTSKHADAAKGSLRITTLSHQEDRKTSHTDRATGKDNASATTPSGATLKGDNVSKKPEKAKEDDVGSADKKGAPPKGELGDPAPAKDPTHTAISPSSVSSSKPKDKTDTTSSPSVVNPTTSVGVKKDGSTSVSKSPDVKITSAAGAKHSDDLKDSEKVTTLSQQKGTITLHSDSVTGKDSAGATTPSVATHKNEIQDHTPAKDPTPAAVSTSPESRSKPESKDDNKSSPSVGSPTPPGGIKKDAPTPITKSPDVKVTSAYDAKHSDAPKDSVRGTTLSHQEGLKTSHNDKAIGKESAGSTTADVAAHKDDASKKSGKAKEIDVGSGDKKGVPPKGELGDPAPPKDPTHTAVSPSPVSSSKPENKDERKSSPTGGNPTTSAGVKMDGPTTVSKSSDVKITSAIDAKHSNSPKDSVRVTALPHHKRTKSLHSDGVTGKDSTSHSFATHKNKLKDDAPAKDPASVAVSASPVSRSKPENKDDNKSSLSIGSPTPPGGIRKDAPTPITKSPDVKVTSADDAKHSDAPKDSVRGTALSQQNGSKSSHNDKAIGKESAGATTSSVATLKGGDLSKKTEKAKEIDVGSGDKKGVPPKGELGDPAPAKDPAHTAVSPSSVSSSKPESKDDTKSSPTGGNPTIAAGMKNDGPTTVSKSSDVKITSAADAKHAPKDSVRVTTMSHQKGTKSLHTDGVTGKDSTGTASPILSTHKNELNADAPTKDSKPGNKDDIKSSTSIGTPTPLGGIRKDGPTSITKSPDGKITPAGNAKHPDAPKSSVRITTMSHQKGTKTLHTDRVTSKDSTITANVATHKDGDVSKKSEKANEMDVGSGDKKGVPPKGELADSAPAKESTSPVSKSKPENKDNNKSSPSVRGTKSPDVKVSPTIDAKDPVRMTTLSHQEGTKTLHTDKITDKDSAHATTSSVRTLKEDGISKKSEKTKEVDLGSGVPKGESGDHAPASAHTDVSPSSISSSKAGHKDEVKSSMGNPTTASVMKENGLTTPLSTATSKSRNVKITSSSNGKHSEDSKDSVRVTTLSHPRVTKSLHIDRVTGKNNADAKTHSGTEVIGSGVSKVEERVEKHTSDDGDRKQDSSNGKDDLNVGEGFHGNGSLPLGKNIADASPFRNLPPFLKNLFSQRAFSGTRSNCQNTVSQTLQNAKAALSQLNSHGSEQRMIQMVNSILLGIKDPDVVDYNDFFNDLVYYLSQMKARSSNPDVDLISILMEGMVAALETINAIQISGFRGLEFKNDIPVYLAFLEGIF